MKRRTNNSLATIEILEARQLLSASPLGDHLVNLNDNGSQMQAVLVDAGESPSTNAANFASSLTQSSITSSGLSQSNRLSGDISVKVGSKNVAGVFSAQSISSAGANMDDASMLLNTLARARASLAVHPLPDLPEQIIRPVVNPTPVTNPEPAPQPQPQPQPDPTPVIVAPVVTPVQDPTPVETPVQTPVTEPSPAPVQDPIEVAPPTIVELPAPVQDPAPDPAPVQTPAPADPTPSAPANEPAAEDGTTTWVDVSGNPLFGPDGPSPDDIVQGSAADCYFLATISAVARTDPSVIEQDVTQVGSDQYQVNFQNDGVPVDEQVDGLMPADANGNLIYAQLGTDNSIWVPVMEKAFAIFRSAQWGLAADYANIDYGVSSEVFNDLGASGVTDYGSDSIPDGSTLGFDVTEDLYYNTGMAVTFMTLNQDGPLVGNHVYSVVDVSQNDDRSYTLEMRNPWGSTGPNNDGYVWINTNDAIGQFADLATAFV